MKILVFGAGVLGSLYAGRLAAAGQDVAILARGERLRQLRCNGLVLFDEEKGLETRPQMHVVEELRPDDAYDLVVVIVRAEQARDALPVLANNGNVPCVLFLHNWASGPDALTAALGGRVLMGFPGAGGARDGVRVRYRMIREQKTILGEPDGRVTTRLRNVAAMMRSAGFPVALTRRVDAWLKTHAVFITAVAGALYGAGGSCAALARDADGVPGFVRAIRQGFRSLGALGTPIEPRKLAALFLWLPTAVPIAYWRRYFARPEAELIFGRHVDAVPREFLELVQQLRTGMRDAPIPTPELGRVWAAIEQRVRGGPPDV